MPDIYVVDLKKEAAAKKMQGLFSSFLLEAMSQALEKKEQIILFQNRRGFSPRMECELCHYISTCKNCDVSLTYHKNDHSLRCHYCGYTISAPVFCPKCTGKSMQLKGFGTEKIEEELSEIFPEIRVLRMDLDSTRNKHAHRNIIEAFENKEVDILVGTQMVTKGLDFGNVSVVGVLNADNLICFPDFRSYERSFHLLTQVSGRAGRGSTGGKVIIQSYNLMFRVIKDVINQDYGNMYRGQIAERQSYKYPPYYRLIQLSLKHTKAELVNEGADLLSRMLSKKFGDRVLGPDFPLVPRIQNYYIKNILLKIERGTDIGKAKAALHEVLQIFAMELPYRNLRINVDVDPYA